MNTVASYENKVIRFSSDNPILLVELYTDIIIEYGVRFSQQGPSGLLIATTTKGKFDNNRLADGAFCIYTNKHSDCRFYMPSPNVQFEPLTMHRFAERTNFKSLSNALMQDQILSTFAELSLDIYVNVWRSAGGNIGRKIDNKIKWEKAFHLN
jgi:hypothetical protein